MEEINELIAELDPDENGYVDWIQWVTQLISVSFVGFIFSQDIKALRSCFPNCFYEGFGS